MNEQLTALAAKRQGLIRRRRKLSTEIALIDHHLDGLEREEKALGNRSALTVLTPQREPESALTALTIQKEK